MDVLDTRRNTVRQVVARAQGGFTAIAVEGRTGRAFAADEAGNVIIMIDARRGRLLHTTPVGTIPSAIAVAPGGRVFVGTDDGVSVLDARTGARLRALPQPRIVSGIAVDSTRGRVFIADFEPGDYALYTFDARTTALLHETGMNRNGVGTLPIALAIDGGRGHVYVLMISPPDKNLLPVGPASVSVVDAATGALRTSVNLSDTVTAAGGGRTFGIAVDTRAHRLIALTDTHVIILDTTHL